MGGPEKTISWLRRQGSGPSLKAIVRVGGGKKGKRSSDLWRCSRPSLKKGGGGGRITEKQRDSL